MLWLDGAFANLHRAAYIFLKTGDPDALRRMQALRERIKSTIAAERQVGAANDAVGDRLTQRGRYRANLDRAIATRRTEDNLCGSDIQDSYSAFGGRRRCATLMPPMMLDPCRIIGMADSRLAEENASRTRSHLNQTTAANNKVRMP